MDVTKLNVTVLRDTLNTKTVVLNQTMILTDIFYSAEAKKVVLELVDIEAHNLTVDAYIGTKNKDIYSTENGYLELGTEVDIRVYETGVSYDL